MCWLKPNYFTNKKLFFDIVISRHFLEHTIKPKEILSDILKVMKSNGYLILEIFNKKAIYLYLRELTGLNTKQVVNCLNKMRANYRKFKKDWN